MGHSVLQVPVPQLEEFVRARTEHHDRDYLSADPAFTHAHVTVLGPFLDHVDDEAAAKVARIARQVESFDFVLGRVATFPNGIIHLVPEPAAPFSELTAGSRAAFPECPPYAGQFAPAPHLTLDLASDVVTEESTRARLALPVACRAERIDLAWYEPGACRVLASWPLG